MKNKFLYVLVAILAMTAMVLAGCSSVSNSTNNPAGTTVAPGTSYSSATGGAYDTAQPSATAAATTDNGTEWWLWVLLAVAIISVLIWLARRRSSTTPERRDQY